MLIKNINLLSNKSYPQIFHPCGSHSLRNVFSIELFYNIKHTEHKSVSLSSLLKIIQFTFNRDHERSTASET